MERSHREFPCRVEVTHVAIDFRHEQISELRITGQVHPVGFYSAQPAQLHIANAGVPPELEKPLRDVLSEIFERGLEREAQRIRGENADGRDPSDDRR